MFAPSATAGIGLPQRSVADYLVTAIKPDLQIIRERIKGLLFEKRVYSLFPSSRNESLEASFTNYQLSLVGSIAGSPSWFDAEKYVNWRIEGLTKYLAGDKELSSALKRFEKDTDVEDRETAGTFSEVAALLAKRMLDDYEHGEVLNAYRLLESDLPPNYFYLTGNLDRSELLSMHILKARSQRLENELQVQRDFAMWRRTAERFKKQLGPLVVAGRAASDVDSRLDIYLKMCNSSSMEELFKFRTPTMRSVDEQQLQHYLDELKQALYATSREASLLLASDPILERSTQSVVRFPLSESAAEFQSSLALAIVG